MRIRTGEYFVREVMISLKRNAWMSFASISTVAVSLLILGLFLIIVLNLNNMASNLESKVEISVYLKNDLKTEEITALQNKVEAMPAVDSVKFVGKAEALERFKERLGDQKVLLEALDNTNPLPDAFEVRTKSPETVKPMAETITKLEGVESAQFGQDVIEKLFEMTKMVRIFGVVIIIFLTLATVFIISNTIRLTVFARRREIGIMKYVGATNWFIRWPFLIEGMILGFFGSFVAMIVLRSCYSTLTAWIYNTLTFLPLIPEYPFLNYISILLLCVGTLIGALGSTISLKRFMNV